MIRPEIVTPEAGALEALAVTRDRWASATGDRCACEGAGGERAELVLDAVSPLRASPGQEAFSLEFLGPVAAPLGQGSHTVDRGALGREALFMVPVAREGDRIRYEAIFSRLVAPSTGASHQTGASPRHAGRSA